MKKTYSIADVCRVTGLDASMVRIYAKRQKWQGKESGWKLSRQEFETHCSWLKTNLTFINPRAQKRAVPIERFL